MIDTFQSSTSNSCDTMAHESSVHGQLSPPHSNHEDRRVNEVDYRPTQYNTPPMHSTRTFAYGDPEVYSMQDSETLYDQHAFFPGRSYHTPPRPIGEGGMQTRSGRSLGTPATTGSPSSRASQSPGRQKRNKRVRDKHIEYKIDEPLSIMTEDYDIPVEDMMAWVNRPDEERWEEVRSKHKNKVPRPMNSFMLYRRAYKERIKRWGAQGDNNQLISSVAGISWNLEPRELKEFYAKIADIERKNHSKAFPDYKFTPNKSVKKRDRDDDMDESDPDWDGGSAYSSKRHRGRNNRDVRSRSSTPAQMAYESPPYHPSSYQANNPHLIPMVSYEQWTQPIQYGQIHPYDQLAYPRQTHVMNYGPTSFPVQQDPYISSLIGLPPARDVVDGDSMFQGEFAIDPSLGDHQSSMSYQYGSFSHSTHDTDSCRGQVMYNEQTELALHPGMHTLAPTETSWSASHGVGGAFDAEFDGWHEDV